MKVFRLILHRNSIKEPAIKVFYTEFFQTQNMKQVFLSLLLLLLVVQSGFAQNLAPLGNGEYSTSANDVVAGIPPTPYKVMATVEGSEKDKFTLSVTTNGRYGSEVDFARFEGNIFAPVDNEGLFITPTKNFVVLYPGVVMELYVTKGLDNSPEIDRVIAIAPSGAKFGDLKKSAKDHANAFKFVEMNNKLAKANEAVKVKIAQEKAAKEAAAAKAAEEKKIADEARRAADAKAREEANAKASADKAARDQAYAARTASISKTDFCTGITKYSGMAKSRFKALKGKILPADDLYGAGDTTFAANEVLNLFDFGIVQTRHKSSNNATDLAFYFEVRSVDDVHTHYDLVLARLKTCMTEGKGWRSIDHDGSFTWYNDKCWVRLHKKFNSYNDNIPDNTLELEITQK
jgi:hypothetical protein